MSTQTIWTIVSSGLLVVIAAFVGYSYINLKPPVIQETPTQYSLGVLQEMQAPSTDTKANVFEKAASLHNIPQSQGESVDYAKSELGKTDLSHPE